MAYLSHTLSLSPWLTITWILDIATRYDVSILCQDRATHSEFAVGLKRKGKKGEKIRKEDDRMASQSRILRVCTYKENKRTLSSLVQIRVVDVFVADPVLC